MDKPANSILGISEGSTNSPESSVNYFKSQTGGHEHRESKFISLRVGEIVQGSIVEVYSDKEVLVKLPIGTLTATLMGKLKKGDALFFRVMEIDPGLVLRIYAVGTRVKSKENTTEELVRILDLPDHPFYMNFFEYIKNKRTLITRDEMLLFFKSYISLPEEEHKQETVINIYKTLHMMKDALIPLKTDLYFKLKPFFIGEKNILNNFEIIYRNIDQFPPKILALLNQLFTKMRNPSTAFADLIQFFTIDTVNKNEPTVFWILKQISAINKNAFNPQSFNTIMNAVVNLIKAIEGQNIYNAFAQQNNSSLIFFIPVLHAGNFRFAQIIITRKGKTKDNKYILKFQINTDTDIVDLVTQDKPLANQPGTIIQTEAEVMKLFLNRNINLIREHLVKQNFVIDDLTLNHVPHDYSYSSIAGDNSPKSISVVI
jgi:hypothetical protein